MENKAMLVAAFLKMTPNLPEEPKKESESENEYNIRKIAKQLAVTSYMTENRMFGPYEFTDDPEDHIIKIENIKIIAYKVLEKATYAMHLVEQRIEDPDAIPYFRIFAEVKGSGEPMWTNKSIIITDLKEYYTEKHPLILPIVYTKLDLEAIKEEVDEKYSDQF